MSKAILKIAFCERTVFGEIFKVLLVIRWIEFPAKGNQKDKQKSNNNNSKQ